MGEMPESGLEDAGALAPKALEHPDWPQLGPAPAEGFAGFLGAPFFFLPPICITVQVQRDSHDETLHKDGAKLGN